MFKQKTTKQLTVCVPNVLCAGEAKAIAELNRVRLAKEAEIREKKAAEEQLHSILNRINRVVKLGYKKLQRMERLDLYEPEFEELYPSVVDTLESLCYKVTTGTVTTFTNSRRHWEISWED